MDHPPVSVFMAVRDEEADLADCVARIFEQDYPGEFELVVAVAPSADRTGAIAAQLAEVEPRLTVVANPAGFTPHGLNAAIAAARHDILIRADGHALFPGDYVSRVVATLLETGAANVGGRMVPVGDAPVSRAIAHAMGSRFGIGGAAFHTGAPAGPQPTVYLGGFRRSAIESVGGYDEHFVRAQDWELNHRLRKAGHTVWFEPSIGVTYRPRSSWRTFGRQQYRTGGWRRRVIERHPETAGLRYLAPPTAVVAVMLGLVLGIVGLFTTPWLLLGFVVPAAYVLGATVAGLFDARRLDGPARARVPIAMAVMHMAWGWGFLTRST